MAPAPAFASFRIILAFRNVTCHRVLGTPCQSRPTEIMKFGLLHLLYIIKEYNSDRDVLEYPSTPQITITLVVHPGGENHELANNHPNHELAITSESALLLWWVSYEYRILVGS